MGILKYVKTYTCLVMATTWFKILIVIDNCKKIIQARDATVDVEVNNIESLLQHLNMLRENWDKMWCEIQNVAEALGLDSESHHGFKGIRKDLGELTADTYKINILYKVIDNVTSAIRDRFQAITAINSTFRFL